MNFRTFGNSILLNIIEEPSECFCKKLFGEEQLYDVKKGSASINFYLDNTLVEAGKILFFKTKNSMTICYKGNNLYLVNKKDIIGFEEDKIKYNQLNCQTNSSS